QRLTHVTPHVPPPPRALPLLCPSYRDSKHVIDRGLRRRESWSHRTARALANTGEVDVPAQLDRDEELLEALRQREPTAAERLVVTYRDRAYRLAARITRDGEDAEEVVQDAFWAVVRKIDSFRGESTFGTWLFRIVANAAYQKLRSRQSRR